MPKLLKTISLLASLAAFCAIVSNIGGTRCLADDKPATSAFTLTSPAFVDGGTLPAEFTCDGKRASPPLDWANAPSGTKSFAITMHHIPGPGEKHVYMVIYNIPVDVHSLPENAKDIGTFGINTVNRQQQYTPPCSKGPGPKKYTMTVYALSAKPIINQPADSVTMDDLLAAIKNMTLAKAEINVTYSRPQQGEDAPPPPPDANAGTGPQDQPTQDQQGQDQPRQDQPTRRRQGGPEQRAIDQLQLTDDQKSKIGPIIQQFHEQQNKLRDELLAKMKSVLTDQQYQQFEAAIRRPPQPRDQGGADAPPPKPN